MSDDSEDTGGETFDLEEDTNRMELPESPWEVDLPEDAGAADAAERPRVETKLAWSGPGRLVFDPVLRQVGASTYRVEGKQEKAGEVAWGFWGVLVVVGVIIAALAGQYSLYSVTDVLWVIVGVAVGVMLYQYGRGSTLHEEVLFEIDEQRRVVRWPDADSDDEWGHEVPFDRVTEGVFGLTRLPVSEATAGVNVDAFTFLVRVDEDTLRPVIEGSPYKGDVHEIARFISEMLGVELTYVGRGM